MKLTPLAVCAALAATPLAAFDVSQMKDHERKAFRAEIRAYLMENPELIIEAVNTLEARQAEQQEQADVELVTVNAEEIFNDGFSWVGGNPDGDITIVEFSDYRCGYCRKAHPEVVELLESDGNIRLIMKEFPILGEASTISSRFAIATRQIAGDDAYKVVHDSLISLTSDVNEAVLGRLGNTLGLDTDAILAHMDSAEVTAEINATRALAQRLQINGTPTFVFQDELVRGYVPLEAMQSIVKDIRDAS